MNSERREDIKDVLRKRGEIKLKELEEMFPEVSSMTLRRDLKYLEDHGFVKRTRGGAVAMSRLSVSAENVYAQRALENVGSKYSIAKKALQFVETGRSIYIDAGTTTTLFAREMPDMHLSVMTSGLNIAGELMKKQMPMVSLVGGQINRNTISVSGVSSVNFLNEMNIDIAFMAASAFNMDNGFTSGNYTESELKKAVINRARKTVMMMDSSKSDKSMPFTFAMLSDIDVLISDENIDDALVEAARQHGVEIL